MGVELPGPHGDGGVATVTCFGGGTAAPDPLAVTEGPGTWLAALAELRPELDLETLMPRM